MNIKTNFAKWLQDNAHKSYKQQYIGYDVDKNIGRLDEINEFMARKHNDYN